MKALNKIICVALAMAIPLHVQAGTGYRTAVITEVQSSAKSASASPRMSVAQSGNWTVTSGGSVDCPLDWTVFDVVDNPHFVATVLAAGIADRVVRVYVDDSVKVNGTCQIMFLSLLPAT